MAILFEILIFIEIKYHKTLVKYVIYSFEFKKFVLSDILNSVLSVYLIKISYNSQCKVIKSKFNLH